MIEHVYRRAAACRNVDAVVVATDDERIAQVVRQFGGDVRLTSPTHPTGTDRLAEVAAHLDCDLIVNVQGDEPLIDPALIREVAGALAARPEASIATAAHPIDSAETFFDPNVVKVVIDDEGFAQYFSRAPIPYAREAFAQSRAALPAGLPAYRHIGIYAYRVRFLKEFSSLAPTGAERFEALEQLRALGHGHRIVVSIWDAPLAPGVDTPQDLERVRRELSQA